MQRIWIVFLGKVGGEIRIQGKIGIISNMSRDISNDTLLERIVIPQNMVWINPTDKEFLYPANSNSIEFQDIKIEVIEATESRITFKLTHISTDGCDKVNGQ